METQQPQPSSAVAPKATVKSLLASANYQKSFEKVLGDRAPQFMASVANLAAAKHLADAEPKSVIGAAFIAATLDLPVDKNLGFAFIVPYRTKGVKIAQFQLGYKGFIQLGLRSGKYLTMNDCVIPKGVLRSYNELTGELDLDWSKKMSDEPAGYAFFFKLTSGFTKTVYWSAERVEAHARRYSKNFGNSDSIWATNFDAMALKTVIKSGLTRYGLLTVQMQDAIAMDQGVKPDLDAAIEYPDAAVIDIGEVDEGEPAKGATGAGLREVDVTTQGGPVTTIPAEKEAQPDSRLSPKALAARVEGLALDLDWDPKKILSEADRQFGIPPSAVSVDTIPPGILFQLAETMQEQFDAKRKKDKETKK